MDTYSKHVLEGAIAGAVTGIAVAVLLLLVEPQGLEGMIEELLRQQIKGYGLALSEVEEVVKQVTGLVRTILAIAPIAYVLQYTLLGALFGLLKGFLNLRLNLGRVCAALATGATYAVLLGVTPLVALSRLYPELVGVIAKYLPNFQLLALAPAAIFTVALVVISATRGPWTRVAEAKPKEY